MKNADVSLTNMYGNIRVTFNSSNAILAANNEPEICNFLTHKDDMLYLDVKKSRENKKNVLIFCKANNLRVIDEK